MDLDARLYADFHELQKKADKEFLQKFVPKMSWNNGSYVIMDVGCGPGNITLHILLSLIPEIKDIIGIDISPDMIQVAKTRNSHPKISYYVADIADECTLKRWRGKISHLVSTYCLHWLQNQKIGFENIWNLLRDDGEAILLIARTSPYYDAQIGISNSSKWQRFLKNAKLVIPEWQAKHLDVSHYKDVLEEIGFSVLACEERHKCFVFENNDMAREAVAGTSCLTTHIPEEMRNNFKEDLLEYTIKHCGSDSMGRLTLKYQDVMLHLRKPSNVDK